MFDVTNTDTVNYMYIQFKYTNIMHIYIVAMKAAFSNHETEHNIFGPYYWPYSLPCYRFFFINPAAGLIFCSIFGLMVGLIVGP